MCTLVTRPIGSAIQTVYNGLGTACSAVVDSYNSIGHKIERLTNDHLYAPLAAVIQSIFWSMPTTIALVALPLERMQAHILVGALLLLSEEGMERDLGKELAAGFYAGIRNFSLFQAGINFLKYDATGYIWHAAHLSANIFFALFAHEKANPQLVTEI